MNERNMHHSKLLRGYTAMLRLLIRCSLFSFVQFSFRHVSFAYVN